VPSQLQEQIRAQPAGPTCRSGTAGISADKRAADFDPQRLKNSTALLYNDLLRQGHEDIAFEAAIKVTVAGAGDVEVPILAVRKGGKRFAIALSGLLTTDHPADPSIRELREKASDIQVIVINELLVRGNLPAATREVQQRLGA
jgi:hypothetical protein